MSTDNQIEQEIQKKGLTAPRITQADIEAAIAAEHYFTAKDGVNGADPAVQVIEPSILSQITVCVLILRNGHKIVGVNEGPVSPENFDSELGRKFAREKATEQIWSLLGYELRTKLSA